MTYLYFARDKNNSRIKIGTSRQPQKRKKKLECDHQCSLEFLALIPESAGTENQVHRMFAKLRLAGPGREWYRDSAAIRRFAAKCALGRIKFDGGRLRVTAVVDEKVRDALYEDAKSKGLLFEPYLRKLLEGFDASLRKGKAA